MLQNHLQILRQSPRLIAVGAAGGLLLGAFAASQAPGSVYEGTVRIAVEPPSDEDLEQLLFGSSQLGTQREIIKSVDLVKPVLEGNGIPLSGGEVKAYIEAHVDVEPVADSSVLKITVSDAVATRAATLSQGLAQEYLQYVSREARRRLDRALALLETERHAAEARLRSIDRQLTSGAGAIESSVEEDRDRTYAELRFLAAQAAELKTTSAVAERAVIIQGATVDREAGPRAQLIVFAGLLFGLAVGAILAFGRQRFDPVVRREEDVAASDAGTMLGRLSLVGEGAGQTPDCDASTVEAYRRLRARVLAASAQAAPAAIAVVPVSSAEGSELAANLALSMVRSGRGVLFVDGTMGSEYEAKMRRILQLPAHLGGNGDVVAVYPGLRVLLNFAQTFGPDALGGPDFAKRVESAASDGSVIVLTPAWPDAGEVLELARWAGEAILVAVAGTTRKAHLSEAARALRDVGTEVLGVAFVAGSSSKPQPNAGASNEQVPAAVAAAS